VPSACLTFDVRSEEGAPEAAGGGILTSGMAMLRASRRLARGDEVTIDYGGPLHAPGTAGSTQREKREHLRAQYHFTCTCILCEPLVG
jgi:hypothetical protein